MSLCEEAAARWYSDIALFAEPPPLGFLGALPVGGIVTMDTDPAVTTGDPTADCVVDVVDEAPGGVTGVSLA